MWIVSVLIYLGFALAQIHSADPPQVQEAGEYPQFKSEVFEKGRFNIVFESAVSRLNNVEEYPIFWEEMRAHYKHLSDADFLRYYQGGKFFKYIYTFRNIEKSKLKINFSAWEILSSPLVDIFQDFSLNVSPDEVSIEISFVALGAPEKIYSPLNIMFWREGGSSQGRWILYRAGSRNIYVPSTLIYIRKEIETIIRRTDGQQ